MLRKLWGLIAAAAVVLSLVVQVDPAAARSYAPVLALPCQAANASATLSWQDTSGALRGKLTFVNRSSASCSLIGRPTILLLANGTQVLPVVVTLPSSTFTHFGIGTVAPVTLASRDSATVSLQWYNWCGARPRTLGLIYALPTGGGGFMLPLNASGHNGGVLVPHCDNQILPSHLDVGLFQHA